MTTKTSLMHRTLAPIACLAAVLALSGCGNGGDLGPPNPTGATDIGGPNMSTPVGGEPKEVPPQNQQQAQDTLLGYIRQTLRALPPGYALDATRFGGTGSGNVGCDDNATRPDAPTRFNATGDLTVPPGVDNAAIAEAFGEVWRSWGWHVYTDDEFRKPNQFGVSPDGYRFRVVARAVTGQAPGFEGSTPCFPGNLASDDIPFPAVIDAES